MTKYEFLKFIKSIIVLCFIIYFAKVALLVGFAIESYCRVGDFSGFFIIMQRILL